GYLTNSVIDYITKYEDYISKYKIEKLKKVKIEEKYFEPYKKPFAEVHYGGILNNEDLPKKQIDLELYLKYHENLDFLDLFYDSSEFQSHCICKGKFISENYNLYLKLLLYYQQNDMLDCNNYIANINKRQKP
ncbi:1858_t:CDS:2, partial [Racocetra persica]